MRGVVGKGAALAATALAALAAVLLCTAATGGGPAADQKAPSVMAPKAVVAAPSATLEDLEAAIAAIESIGEQPPQVPPVAVAPQAEAWEGDVLCSSDAIDALAAHVVSQGLYGTFAPVDCEAAGPAEDGSWHVSGTAGALLADLSFGGDVWVEADVGPDGSVSNLALAKASGLSDYAALMAVSEHARTQRGYSMFAVYDYGCEVGEDGARAIEGTASAVLGSFGGDVAFSAEVSALGEVLSFAETSSSAAEHAMVGRIEQEAASRGLEGFAVESCTISREGTVRSACGQAAVSGGGSVSFRALLTEAGDVVSLAFSDAR